MRSDHPDPAERELLNNEDLAIAEFLDNYLAAPAGLARDRFWARAVHELGPIAACRLNTAIALYEPLPSSAVRTPTRRS